MASMEEKAEQKTHQEKTSQMDSQNNNSSEKIDSNISDIKAVTLVSSNSYSKSPSFSKLLEGVIMAANSSISQDPLVKTVGFESKSGMSHQEVLGNVSEKTTQKGNSRNSDEPPGNVPRTPKSDGYCWRKYGQKQVKGSGSSRSYYRCTSLSCYAKKKVQHLDLSGEVIDVVYKGDHNHDPPQNLRVTSRKKDSTPRVSHDSSDLVLPNIDGSRSLDLEGDLKKSVPSTHECQDKNQNDEVIASPKAVTEEHSKIVDTVSRPKNVLAIVPKVEEQSDSRSDNSNELAMIDPMKVLDVAPLKKRRIKEKAKACSEPVYRTFKDPKVVVLADSDVGLSSDGYRWRKYGQKMVKGTPHPRSYYRCSSVGCPVRKHVERATDNSTKFIVTYEGEHDHDSPTPKSHNQLASPNVVSSDTNTKSPSRISTEDQSSIVEEDKKGSENGGGDNKALESAKTLLSIGIELKSC